MKNGRKRRLFGWIPAGVAVAAAGVLAMPAETRAGDDWSFHVSLGDGHHSRHIAPVRTVYASRAYDRRATRVWVPAVYEERVVLVDVPAVYHTREVPRYDRFGRFTGYRTIRERVEPARTVRRIERILVREGYYRTIRERVAVRRLPTRMVHDYRHVGIDLGGLHIDFGHRKHHERKHHDAGHLVRRVARASFGH